MFDSILIILAMMSGAPRPVPDAACAALERIVSAVEPAGPAVAGAVIQSGEVTCERVAGVPNLDEAYGAADRHSAFYLASLAKPMTAAAILRLASDGAVSLDDSVQFHLPLLPEQYDGVTLRHLLRHESGTPDHFDHFAPEAISGLTNENVVEFLRNHGDLDFEPGERWAYSNSAYVLLAEVVERVTGDEFGDWMERHLFEPLGMEDAFIGNPERPVVHAYEPEPDGGWRRSAMGPRTEGPGGIHASLADLEAWFLAVRRGEVFEPEVLVQALAPTKTRRGKLTPFTIAFQVEDIAPGLYYAGSFGLLGGNRHALLWLPDRDAAFILLAARPDVTHQPLVEGVKQLHPSQ